ncbi:MAG: hypothetical protein IPI48_18105 [bacterium]|nr:hypothetical protein [bacterium]
MDSFRTGFTAYDCSFSNNTGNGGATAGTSVAGDFFDCRFNGNGGSGLVHGGVRWSGPVLAQIQRCQFNGNGMNGYSSGACITARRIAFEGCEFIGNTGNGIFDAYGASVTSSVIADNGGWGMLHRIMPADPSFDTLNECEVLRNQDGGIWCDSRGAHGGGGVSASGCLVAENGGAGIVGVMGRNPGSFRDCVVSGNLGPAIVLSSIIPDDYPQSVQSQFLIEGNTIVDNTGPGLHCRFTAGYTPGRDTLKLSLLNSIICRQDTAMTIDGFQPDTLLVACTDIFGNTAGDWVGPLAAFANTAGNLSVDPLFCADANPSDPWTLHADSPLAAENNVACGQIGARGAACASTVVACRSVHVYDPVTGAYNPNQLNREVTVEGVVYVAPGTYSDTGGGYLQDETGGINFWRWPVPENIQVGDRLRITGPIWPWLGELHVGTYTFAKLDSAQSCAPTALTLASLLGDFANTGSHVRVIGTVTDVTPDSFLLRDGALSVEVRRNAFGNVDFSALQAGKRYAVDSPCFKRGRRPLPDAGRPGRHRAPVILVCRHRRR